jgi:hypothetical protein
MGLSITKANSITGLALISAIVAGCGGGGGSSPAAGGPPAGGPPAATFTTGNTVCAATSSPETVGSSSGAILGSCEQYEASAAPTRASTAFKSSTGTLDVVVYNGSAGYDINLPLVSATKATLVQGNLIDPAKENTSFGNVLGVAYGISDSNTGAGARVFDYRNTTELNGVKKVLDLNSSRFGIFNRFIDRTQGYYGGWAEVAKQGNIPTGTVTFTGPIVGVIGPSATNTAIGTPAGYSATMTIEVDFASPGSPIKTLTIANFGYSANGGTIIPQPVSAGAAQVTVPSLNVTTKALSGSFAIAPVGTSSAIAEGRFAGSFTGAANVTATEFVGTLKFRTADGRNAIGAFGTRSGLTVN